MFDNIVVEDYAMERNLVRIEEIKIKGIKNVLNGNIKFREFQNISKGDFSFHSVLGIYGPNGSGKTTILESTLLLRDILQGNSLPDDIGKYINNDTNEAQLSYTFYIQNSKFKRLVTYIFTIGRVKEITNDKILADSYVYDIIYEKLFYKEFDEIEREYKKQVTLFESEKDSIILSKLNNKLSEAKMIEMKVVKDIQKGSSLLFNTRNHFIIINELAQKDSDKLIPTVTALVEFANNHLIIIENDYIGSTATFSKSDNMPTADALMPINLYLEEWMRKNNNHTVYTGRISVSIFQRNALPEEIYEKFKTVIKNIDIVLNSILPEQHLVIINEQQELLPNDIKGVSFDIVSERNNKYIPLKYESEGIKRLISVISALIAVYNQPEICLMIDEFDSGVFEYLLGELVQVMEESGKGQFVFTSHNLHVLEEIHYKSILFSTTNPKNRFIYLTNIRPTNNVRNNYYAAIQFGGQSEELYTPTKGYRIKRALRKAGEWQNDEEK